MLARELIIIELPDRLDSVSQIVPELRDRICSRKSHSHPDNCQLVFHFMISILSRKSFGKYPGGVQIFCGLFLIF